MNKELTFNDLPMVVAQLRDEVVGMKQMIISLQSQNKPHKANTHIPMSVEEASAYLKMPMATLYMKLGNGSIPATKPGKRYCLYQDELDKWLEANRKNPVPLTAEEENAAILASFVLSKKINSLPGYSLKVLSTILAVSLMKSLHNKGSPPKK